MYYWIFDAYWQKHTGPFRDLDNAKEKKEQMQPLSRFPLKIVSTQNAVEPEMFGGATGTQSKGAPVKE